MTNIGMSRERESERERGGAVSDKRWGLWSGKQEGARS